MELVPGVLLEEPEYYNLYIPDFYNRSAPIFTFDNVTLVWRVLSVNGSYVLVNYTFVLYNVYYVKKFVGLGLIKGEFYRDEWVLVSAVLMVDLRTMYVYTVNGSFVGRWPFWINTYDLYNGFENHTYHTIVYNVRCCDPSSPNATLTHLNFMIYFVGSDGEFIYERV